MACSNNNDQSLGGVSQRILFKLDPLWVVYVKGMCGAAGDGTRGTKQKRNIIYG